MASVAFESVRKVFGKTVALKDVRPARPRRRVHGPAWAIGLRKTTLLRCLAGLERIDGGTVRIGDRDVSTCLRATGTSRWLPVLRGVPHMKVYDNIAFGLRMRKKPKARSSAG